MVINGEAPIAGSEFAEANLRRLIAYTRDADLSNRDWATFHLANTGIDTLEVRAALHARLLDEHPAVQEEAMLGLAQRHDRSALPLLQVWLQSRPISQDILEAAGAFADQSLCALLCLRRPSTGNEFLSFLWNEAYSSCECGASS